MHLTLDFSHLSIPGKRPLFIPTLHILPPAIEKLLYFTDNLILYFLHSSSSSLSASPSSSSSSSSSLESYVMTSIMSLSEREPVLLLLTSLSSSDTCEVWQCCKCHVKRERDSMILTTQGALNRCCILHILRERMKAHVLYNTSSKYYLKETLVIKIKRLKWRGVKLSLCGPVACQAIILH